MVILAKVRILHNNVCQLAGVVETNWVELASTPDRQTFRKSSIVSRDFDRSVFVVRDYVLFSKH